MVSELEFFVFHRCFRLFQAVTAFVFQSISLWLFSKVARRLFATKSKDVSLLLKALLVLWIIEDIATLPYSIYNAVFWRLFDATQDYFTISFWMIIWERAISCTLPVTVFFLTLDRCLMLHFGLKYRRRYTTMLFAASTIIGTLASAMTLYLYIASKLNPPADPTVPTKANGFDFFRLADDWQFLVRVTFGTLNFLCSLIFFALLRREHAKQMLFTTNTTHKKAGNKFVLYAVCSEVLLNFLPHAAVLAVELIAQVNISQHFGQYSRELTSIDALACAIMYRQVKKPVSDVSTGQGKSITVTAVQMLTQRTQRRPSRSVGTISTDEMRNGRVRSS